VRVPSRRVLLAVFLLVLIAGTVVIRNSPNRRPVEVSAGSRGQPVGDPVGNVGVDPVPTSVTTVAAPTTTSTGGKPAGAPTTVTKPRMTPTSGPVPTTNSSATTTTATTARPATPGTLTGTGSFDDYGLYAIDVDGTNLRKIAAFGAYPAGWSPNGTWIAYSGATFLNPRTGETRQQIAPAAQANGGEKPAWSPESTRVAFIGAPPTDLQNPQPIVRDVWIAAVAGGPSVRIATPEEEIGVEWLPDGRIAALSRDGIWTFNPDGSDRRHVYSGKLPALIDREQAAWGTLEASRDGRFLGVVTFLDGATLVVGVDGTNPRFVASPDEAMRILGTVAWSPTAGEFLVARRLDGKAAAFVLGSDDTTERLIDPSLARPAWSPTGENVAGYDDLAGSRYLQLVTEQPDGTGRRTILTLSGKLRLDDYAPPAFSPDGRTILFQVTVPD
jgi:hypothetical protein